MFIPAATTRAGTAQRAIPTIALNTYVGFADGGRRDARPTLAAPAPLCGPCKAPFRFFECTLTMNCPVRRRAGVSPAQRALARERERKSAVGLYVFSVVGTSRCDVRAA